MHRKCNKSLKEKEKCEKEEIKQAKRNKVQEERRKENTKKGGEKKDICTAYYFITTLDL